MRATRPGRWTTVLSIILAIQGWQPLAAGAQPCDRRSKAGAAVVLASNQAAACRRSGQRLLALRAHHVHASALPRPADLAILNCASVVVQHTLLHAVLELSIGAFARRPACGCGLLLLRQRWCAHQWSTVRSRRTFSRHVMRALPPSPGMLPRTSNTCAAHGSDACFTRQRSYDAQDAYGRTRASSAVQWRAHRHCG